MSLRTWTAAVLVFGLFLPGGALAQVVHEGSGERLARQPGANSGQQPDLARVAELIREQTNAFRKQEQRAPLKENQELARAARYFADYLAQHDKFSHTADGNQPWDRVKKYGYSYCLVAENIAYEYDSAGFSAEELARRLMEGWEKSPGHRKNLLDPDITEIGVAVARSERTGAYYAVQDFGRPHSARLEFEVTNATDTTIRYQGGERSYPLPPGFTRTHEVCRPTSLTFRWPTSSTDRGPTIQPRQGDHLVVTENSAGQFLLKKQ